VTYTKETRYIQSLQREAILYIALPENYHSHHKHYPVLYMHDGHNLFDVEDSYAHAIWDVIGAFKRNPTLAPCIVVALSCAMEGHQRLDWMEICLATYPMVGVFRSHRQHKALCCFLS